VHRRRECLLHHVACSVGVSCHGRRNTCENVEAAAVQGLQLVQARSAASDHTTLMHRMSDFFSRAQLKSAQIAAARFLRAVVAGSAAESRMASGLTRYPRETLARSR
jgi:hypothetical protein